MKSSTKDAFKNKEYRHGYADEFLNTYIATQIKVLREQRGWSQKDLAINAKMKQPRISVLENVNYSSWSINALRKLAEAFDLTLCVSFESFGKRIKDFDEFGRANLEKLSFDNDPAFKDKHENLSKEKIKSTILEDRYYLKTFEQTPTRSALFTKASEKQDESKIHSPIMAIMGG